MSLDISEKQLFDYARCPLYYHITWDKGLSGGEAVSSSKLLDKLASYYFLWLLDGKKMQENDLKRKWDVICSDAGIVDPKKVLDGVDMIFRFCRWINSESFELVDFETPYTISVGGCMVKGNTGILVKQYNQLCLLVPDFSTRLPDQLQLDVKLKYTLDCYVLEKLHQMPVAGVRIHNIKNNRDFYTQRGKHDFQRLETSVTNIAQSIESAMYYPREFICSTCSVLDFCKGWCGK